MTFKKENLQIFTYILKKNNISVILSDFPFIEGHLKFKTKPLNLLIDYRGQRTL